MSNLSLHISSPQTEDRPVTAAHLLLLALVSIGAVLWGAVLVLGANGIQFEQYLLLLGFFGLASAIFVFSRIRQNHIGIFYLPVFLTILFFLRFGLAPVICFLDPESLSPDFNGHYRFILWALEYVIIGLLAFWTGCHLAAKRSSAGGPQFAEGIAEQGHAGHSTLAWVMGIYAVVFAIQLYLLHAHLYAYVGTWKAYYANLSSLQVLQTVSSIGGVAVLAFVTIERYFHPSDMPRRLLFWVVLMSEAGWGLASGMKAAALQPFIIVAMISSLIERRFKKGWVAAVLLGILALYPIANNYRRMVLAQGGLASPAAVVTTGLEAFSQTHASRRSASDWVSDGWSMTVNRLDLLPNIGLVLWLGPRTSALRGKERWWMVPYYPFVPRFIWHSKPILDKGRRFSIATGSASVSSMAITYPGDLYADYGMPGIVLGMFLLGIVSQALANTVTGPLDKRRVFIYATMFMYVVRLESDAFGYLTTLIKTFVMLSIVALLIYGPRRRAETPEEKGHEFIPPCGTVAASPREPALAARIDSSELWDPRGP
jgi:hypothetical protein